MKWNECLIWFVFGAKLILESGYKDAILAIISEGER